MNNPDPKIELDSVLKCPHCAMTPFRVFRRQNQNPDGTLLQSFETVLWPAHPDVDPPRTLRRMTCPDCGDELRRVAP